MAIFRATDVVEMALELEKSGKAFYQAVAAKTDDAELKALFQDLAEQEQQHYDTFSKLSETDWAASPSTQREWDEYLMYLQAAIQSHFFEGPDKALALADQVDDKKEALRMAMGFEKDTLLFYHDLRDKVSEADEAMIERVIAEEKTHLRRLAALM